MNQRKASKPARRVRKPSVDLTQAIAVTVGTQTIGALRGRKGGFDVFRARGDGFKFVAKAQSMSKAMTVLRPVDKGDALSPGIVMSAD